MKTKEVEVNGTKYLIAQLSTGQVDEIVFANVDVKQEGSEITATIQGTRRVVREKICPAIAASLNNAFMGNGKWFYDATKRWTDPRSEDEKQTKDAPRWWTPADVDGETIYSEAMDLYAEVTTLSQLRSSVEIVKKTDVKVKLGEEPAASVVQ
jgi:hypothetical protein